MISPVNLKILYCEIEKRNYIITTAELVELGYHKLRIAELVEKKYLFKISHGLYTIPDDAYDKYLHMTRISKHIIFSHESALYLNHLIDDEPEIMKVTVPSDASIGKGIKEYCECFYIKPELYGLGRIEAVTKNQNKVFCYNMERTICDFLRSPKRCGNEKTIEILKKYLQRSDKNLTLLTSYANLFRVIKKLDIYMEVLL